MAEAPHHVTIIFTIQPFLSTSVKITEPRLIRIKKSAPRSRGSKAAVWARDLPAVAAETTVAAAPYRAISATCTMYPAKAADGGADGNAPPDRVSPRSQSAREAYCLKFMQSTSYIHIQAQKGQAMKLGATSLFLSTIFVASCALLAGACTTTSPADDDEAVSSDTVQAVHVIDATILNSLGEWDQIIVDIQSSDDVYVFDPSMGPLDFQRVRIVCPNGNQMPLDAWLQEQSDASGIVASKDVRQPFAISRTELMRNPLAELGTKPESEPGYETQAAPQDCLLCVACSDGGWICFVCWGD
jgi:hypothetical protein